jgi:type I restriction enzyme S subunit
MKGRWDYVPLKRVITAMTRGTAPNYVDDGPVRVIGQAANQTSGVNWTRTRFHASDVGVSRLKGLLIPGDILVNSTGTGTLGRVGQYVGGPDGRPCIADGHITVVRANTEFAHPRFLYYTLSSQPFYDRIYAEMVVGATNQIELSTEKLSRAPIPLPPLEEQRRIADFLDTEIDRIDRLIRLVRSTVDKLLERRAATVYSLVTGASAWDKRESGLPWVRALPSHWVSVKLSLVARMGSGHTPSRSRPEFWVDCIIPWITTGEVSQVRDDRVEEITHTREMISELGLANSAAELCPAGTVVLCRTASAGYSAVMGRHMATSQDFVTWQCGPKLDPYYLLWTLRAMRADLLGRLAIGSTHKTIYVPDLQMLRIPLPPIAEQRDIVSAIREANSKVDRAVDALRQQILLLAERKQALIAEAVTGKFDVTAGTLRHS